MNQFGIVPLNGQNPYKGQFGGTTQVTIEKIVFAKVPQQQDQFFRPYVTNNDTLASSDRVAAMAADTLRGDNVFFNAANVAPIVGDLLQISSTPGQVSSIDNGWGTERYTFQLIAKAKLSTGGTSVYIINGYTDLPSIAIRGDQFYVDPDLILTVNSITDCSEIHDSHGNTMLKPMDSNQVLTKNQWVTTGGNPDSFFSQRPTDVASHMQLLASPHNEEHIYVNDGRVNLSGNVMSRRANSLSTDYTARVFNGFIKTSAELHEESGFQQNFFTAVGATMSESALASNKFLYMLNNRSGRSVSQTNFRWKDLVSLDSQVDQKKFLLADGPNYRRGLPSNGLMTSNLRRTDAVGVAAATMHSAVPALMNQLGLTSITAFITNSNSTFGASHSISISNATCVNPLRVKEACQLFESLLPNAVLVSLFDTTRSQYEIGIHCSIWGETLLKISVDGSPVEDFLMPTFADALTAPVISDTKSTLNDISLGLNTIGSVLMDAHAANSVGRISMPSAPAYKPANTNQSMFGNNQNVAPPMAFSPNAGNGNIFI